jgi:hypothetical protein
VTGWSRDIGASYEAPLSPSSHLPGRLQDHLPVLRVDLPGRQSDDQGSTAGPAAGQAGLDCMGAMVTGNSPTSSCDIPSVTGSWTGVEGPEPVSPRILTAIAMAT